MSFKLNKLIFFCGIVFLFFSSLSQAETEVKSVEDLRELNREIEAKKLPVLLLFTAEDCEYCDAIRNNYLIPMIKSGEYASRVIIRQIYIEDYSYLRNKMGELISGDTIALKYNVEVTPTILFINADWKELTSRIVGVSNIYYFGKLLDEHISQAYISNAKAK